MGLLVAGGRVTQHKRGCWARNFDSLVGSVLLYGGECWALSAVQLLRMEVFHRGCMRAALPARRRERISNVKLYSTMRCTSVATLLARRQMRWLGHLARLDESRVPTRMVSMGRLETGRGAAGCRGASLLGVFGGKGALTGVLERALTREARQEWFGEALARRSRDRAMWFVLAAKKKRWRCFVNSRVI